MSKKALSNGLQPVNIQFLDLAERYSLIPVSGYLTPGTNVPRDLPPTTGTEIVLCPACQHREWQDGIAHNVYECAGCGYSMTFILAN